MWFNVLASDRRDRWDPTLLTDGRVTHLWDVSGDTGRWFQENQNEVGFEYLGGAQVWDAYLLFGANAQWDQSPTELRSFGATVIGKRDLLEDAIDQEWGLQPAT